MTFENPRAIVGDNRPPDHAQRVTDQMARDYAEMANSTIALLGEARDLPDAVDGEAELRRFSDVVVRIRDLGARADSTRKAEKEPYLRGGQAVDGFFNGLIERLDKTTKILTRRINEYQQRKLAEERERRRIEAEAAERAARDAREKAEREAREADERRLAAERARKPESIEQRGALAAEAEQRAADALAEAKIANDKAEDARIDALRKPSEIARSRFDEGRLVTMKQVGYCEIVDKMKLDAAALWPFIKEEHALQALKAWAKIHSFRRGMDGAIVEMRDDTVIR